MTNFGLADAFLRFIESQNDFKEVITSFQNCVYFPRYSGVRTLQVMDIYRKSDTLQKARQFALRFYSQKSRHFTLRDFS